MKKLLTLALLIAGILALDLLFNGSSTDEQSEPVIETDEQSEPVIETDAQSEPVTETGAQWYNDFDEATAVAAETGRDMIIDFTGSDW